MKYLWLIPFAVAIGIGSVAPAQSPSPRENLHITVQKICPISGETLGQRGQPVKVRIDEETVYLCCKACLKNEVNPRHWITIHANIAKAQRICPVMKHELPDNPKWTIVEGQIIFVCCPPCIPKIEADPATYRRQVDQLYEKSLKDRDPSR
ncbi:MAG: hypothetical protein FJ276_14795 [Planctomycetes bacterium]|nr:hypothetical protein [Planctomycetota bacterium]